MKNKSIAKKQSDSKSSGERFLRSLLSGFIAFLISAFILLTVGAFIANKNADPIRLEKPIALSALFISMLLGGAVTSLDFPFGALLGGLGFSAISSVVLCISGIILAKNGSIASSGLYLAISAVLPIIGALVSSAAKSKIGSSGKKRRLKKR